MEDLASNAVNFDNTMTQENAKLIFELFCGEVSGCGCYMIINTW
jgi:hypothetical protein